MSLVEESKLAASKIAFQTRFNRVLVGMDDPIRRLAMDLPSTHPIEQYDFLGAVPGFSEWLDERKMSKRRVDQLTIANKDWANGVRLSRNDIRDDKIALLGIQIDELARKAALHYGIRTIEALIGGFTTTSEFGLAYDGQKFFDVDHQDGAGPAQSNYAGATAFSQAAYDAARATMWSLQDEEGDNLGIVPNFLFVGPTNERLALEVVQAGVIAGPAGESVDNVFRGTATVVVSPRLTGAQAAHWFLADLSRAVRPIIVQIREPITTAMIPASGSADDFSGSDAMFSRRDMKFGAQGSHNSGFGLWQFIHGSNA